MYTSSCTWWGCSPDGGEGSLGSASRNQVVKYCTTNYVLLLLLLGARSQQHQHNSRHDVACSDRAFRDRLGAATWGWRHGYRSAQLLRRWCCMWAYLLPGCLHPCRWLHCGLHADEQWTNHKRLQHPSDCRGYSPPPAPDGPDRRPCPPHYSLIGARRLHQLVRRLQQLPSLWPYLPHDVHDDDVLPPRHPKLPGLGRWLQSHLGRSPPHPDEFDRPGLRCDTRHR
jgi:hypothetical protein